MKKIIEVNGKKYKAIDEVINPNQFRINSKGYSVSKVLLGRSKPPSAIGDSINRLNVFFSSVTAMRS